jgi:cell division septum initiation protein DivIVA
MSLEDNLDTPQFATVMRGYDRLQVDEYVETLTGWLDEATERARHAEGAASGAADEVTALRRRVAEVEQQLAAGPPRTMDQIAERVTGILNEASRTAEAMRAAAEEEAAHVRRSAANVRSEAEAVREAARQEREEARRWAADARALAEAESGELAALLVDEARNQSADLVARAEDDAAAVRSRAVDDIERLRSARDLVLDDLNALRHAIDGALGGAGAPPGDRPAEAKGAGDRRRAAGEAPPEGKARREGTGATFSGARPAGEPAPGEAAPDPPDDADVIDLRAAGSARELA